jgi:excisionase family DNA binding protein
MEWLTLNEAAAYLKIHPRTLGLWARKGKVRAHKLCGIRRHVWRFLRNELDEHMLASSSAVPAEWRQHESTATQ